MKSVVGGKIMIDNIMKIMQNATAEQLKEEINKNLVATKDIEDFNKGKEIIDNLLKLNKTNVNATVKYALLLYSMYKIKGGK